MRKDDSTEPAPASATPETEAIDSSWDDPEISVEIEIQEAHELLEEASIHDRVTAVPRFDPELVLESGFHEVEPPTEDMLAPLDDPAAAFQPDLDSETPSEHPVPIEDRVTPVHAPPPALLELAVKASRGSGDPDFSELKELYAVGDFSGALAIAERLLAASPDDAEARRYVQSCREVLLSMYAARMGSLAQAVSVALPSDQIRWLSLDHRAGFLLSLVDGTSSIEEILDICGMPRLDALRILYTLFEQRVISLSPRE